MHISRADRNQRGKCASTAQPMLVVPAGRATLAGDLRRDRNSPSESARVPKGLPPPVYGWRVSAPLPGFKKRHPTFAGCPVACFPFHVRPQVCFPEQAATPPVPFPWLQGTLSQGSRLPGSAVSSALSVPDPDSGFGLLPDDASPG